MRELIEFMIERQDKILVMLQQHCQMVFTAMAIAIVLGLLIGYLITYNKAAADVVLYIAGLMMTIPSLALFSVLVPIFGLNQKPVIIGLVIYTLLPIIRNTYVGLTNISPALIDSARGMGLTNLEINLKVRFPLALPVVFAGVRTAVVMGIGLGAIAAYTSEGGLGVYIFFGISRGNVLMILCSVVIISVMTVIVDKVLQFFQKLCEKYVS